MNELVKQFGPTGYEAFSLLFSKWDDIDKKDLWKHFNPIKIENNTLILETSDQHAFALSKYEKRALLEVLQSALGKECPGSIKTVFVKTKQKVVKNESTPKIFNK